MNPSITVAIVESPDLAERVPQRQGLVVIVPYGASDMAWHFQRLCDDADRNEYKIDRPFRSDVAQALAVKTKNQTDPNLC
jgi:hypothetical protein